MILWDSNELDFEDALVRCAVEMLQCDLIVSSDVTAFMKFPARKGPAIDLLALLQNWQSPPFGLVFQL